MKVSNENISLFEENNNRFTNKRFKKKFRCCEL